ISSDQFHGEGDRFAAADAETGDAAPTARALQCGEQGYQDSCSTAADRMSERDGAAGDVDLVGNDSQRSLGGQGHDGKSLVDLEEIDLADGPADFVEQFLNCGDRGGCEPFGLLAERGSAFDLGDRRELELAAGRTGCYQERGRSVADARGVAGS